MDSSVLTEDTVVWEPDLQSAIIYSQDSTLIVNNSNETFLTARDDNDSTHYFSVLEDDANSHLMNATSFMPYPLDDEEESQTAPSVDAYDEDDMQEYSVGKIYVVPGEDSNYVNAFQMFYDDEGTLCKRIFKMSMSETGHYERVPDSLEELPLESNIIEEQDKEYSFGFSNKREVIAYNQECNNEETNSDHHDELLNEQILEEQTLNPQTLSEHVLRQQIACEASQFQNGIDDHRDQTLIKQETFQEQYLIDETLTNNENSSENEGLLTDRNGELVSINKINSALSHLAKKEVEASLLEEEPDSDTFEEVYISTHDDIDIRNFNENTNYEFLLEQSESEEDGSSNERSIEEDSDEALEELENIINNGTKSSCERDYDSDEYQIVDGIHITAENEMAKSRLEEKLNHHILKQQPPVYSSNKIVNKENLEEKMRNKENLMFYLIKYPEKENFSSNRSNFPSRNPRSLLKTSFPAYQQKEKTIAALKPTVHNISNGTITNGRRTARNRPNLVQNFHNFLAQTKIVHAPVRPHRLPRKQTHTHVRRPDEDVIVQEVVVSSNGYIETSQDGILTSKVPLKASVFVNLSDSDEDDSKTCKTRKKKRSNEKIVQIPEIVIPDTDDEDQPENNQFQRNIVEIDLSSLDSDEDNGSNTSKKGDDKKETPKKRGRPPKSILEKREAANSNKNASKNDKNMKDKIETKTRWKCSKCPRILPSEGSLESHMHIHNFNKPVTTRKSSIVPNETQKKQNREFECTICKKNFSGHSELLTHKRIHVKRQMVRTSTLAINSPKLTCKAVVSSPKNLSKSFACKHCTKIFSTPMLLKVHTKLHKFFKCSSCNSSFASKLALEDHVRISCVKPSKVEPARRASHRLSTINQQANSGVNVKSRPELKCDTCESTFKTRIALDKHQVIHKEKSPVKKIRPVASNGSAIKKSCKKVGEHSNVPASLRLRGAYSAIRQKLYK